MILSCRNCLTMRFWSRVTNCFRDTWVITCRPLWHVTWLGGAPRPTFGAPTATPPLSVTSGESGEEKHNRSWLDTFRNIGPSDLATPVRDKNGRMRLLFCGEVKKKSAMKAVQTLMIYICPIIEPWDETSGERMRKIDICRPLTESITAQSRGPWCLGAGRVWDLPISWLQDRFLKIEFALLYFSTATIKLFPIHPNL